MIVWYFGLLVFLIDLGEEIAANAMDIAGDRLPGTSRFDSYPFSAVINCGACRLFGNHPPSTRVVLDVHHADESVRSTR